MRVCPADGRPSVDLLSATAQQPWIAKDGRLAAENSMPSPHDIVGYPRVTPAPIPRDEALLHWVG